MRGYPPRAAAIPAGEIRRKLYYDAFAFPNWRSGVTLPLCSGAKVPPKSTNPRGNSPENLLVTPWDVCERPQIRLEMVNALSQVSGS
jgi:hypothetical protein